jgi:hypothetical protein
LKYITLIVELDKSMPLLSFSQISIDEILEQKLFSAKEIFEGDVFSGFYDWLRDKPNSVIGIRFKPFEISSDLAEFISLKSYCTIDMERSEIIIFFSGKRDWVEILSDDAAFGNNAIFVSENGNVCISFGVEDVGSDIRTGLSIQEIFSVLTPRLM